MKTGAIITAAGMPAHMPDYDPTIRMGDTSVIKKIIITLKKAGVEPIVIVTGYRAQNVEKHLAHMGVVFLRNEEYMQNDMLHAVCIGIDYLKQECERVFVIPADIPLFTSISLDLLMEGKKSAICPVYNGKPGHPILLKNDLFEDILCYQGSNGLWGAVTSTGHELEYLDVDDVGVLLELDSQEDFDRLRQIYANRRDPLRYGIQLKIGRNELVFGPGILQFLELVDRTGSMQTACRQMNISYSKGLKMIGLAEKETGLALLERHAGGSEGGVSFLTADGRNFIKKYVCMRGELEERAETLFQQYFGEPDRTEEKQK
ncbi:NTP transferase domain-containing protein [uncultured Sphaerochaeta sp.]|uniref:NTP transferase domain-containing protein n=1 Tax=uncultured Sphaerochaeta sp. TaxID=886478 RepID=UPI002A0A448F|nr:NTP transferase domain-containing protein [uncultured Sphaerochaeta sp.]